MTVVVVSWTDSFRYSRGWLASYVELWLTLGICGLTDYRWTGAPRLLITLPFTERHWYLNVFHSNPCTCWRVPIQEQKKKKRKPQVRVVLSFNYKAFIPSMNGHET